MRREMAVMPGVMFSVQAANAAGDASAAVAAATAVASFFMFINWPWDGSRLAFSRLARRQCRCVRGAAS